jgi:hypothetical protein
MAHVAPNRSRFERDYSARRMNVSNVFTKAALKYRWISVPAERLSKPIVAPFDMDQGERFLRAWLIRCEGSRSGLISEMKRAERCLSPSPVSMGGYDPLSPHVSDDHRQPRKLHDVYIKIRKLPGF